MSRKPANPWYDLLEGMIIAPSLLACDFSRAGAQIDQAIVGGAGVLHFDVMDGHFVPNLSMGPGIAKSIRKFTDRPLDVHLMVTDPAYYLERFAEAGADSITFHVEATNEPMKLINRLRELGLGIGITLRPGTEAQSLRQYVKDVDMVLVMTVEPGYGGQAFMEDMLPKIAEVREMLSPQQRLQVDGGINPTTAGLCAARGADVFVAGADVFGKDDIAGAVRALRQGATKGAASRDGKS